MYSATGNQSYLYLASHPTLAKHAGAFWGGPEYDFLSWDNKLTGAQVLLTRLRLFLGPGYPYEQTLQTFHNQTSIIMCSYLILFKFQQNKRWVDPIKPWETSATSICCECSLLSYPL